jgi:hypothetical protein
MSFLSTKVLSAYNSSKGSSQTIKQIARKKEEINHAKNKISHHSHNPQS